jgi:isoleucyl-tRNA synthetase
MYDFKKVEKDTRKKWKTFVTQFHEAVHDNTHKKIFSFLEGPPTANAPPGLHHLEVRTFKDVINTFWFMQGYSVPRKGGWDTHGLPVEVQVEKKLGLNSKKDIVTYGEAKFIKECRKSVFSNITDWEDSTEELGYHIDLQHPYKTLDNDYIESVWWSLKELYKKKLLYEGYKVVPFCPRCQTPLSSHEVSQGYKDVEDRSVYVLFALKEGGYILAWTTTPWTLPGNVALAVGEKIEYVKVTLSDGDTLILGKEKLDLLKGEYSIVEKLKGKDLVGKAYEPLFDVPELQNERSHKIVLGDFVTTDEGTGVVHTAGMYGEDDYFLCKALELPLIHTVTEEGKFNSLVPKWEGSFVKSKKVEESIIEDLKKRGLLFSTKMIQHPYPFCWRCESPLLYYAINSWFIAVTKVKERMIALNKKIQWYPNHIKEGRFGLWLENIKDWSLSRFKSWGTPLPIWRCSCGKERIIGSVADLRKYSTNSFTTYDLHKPWIDKIQLSCDCGKNMKRISDVIDVWYDSGSASFAQFHYPFENSNEFKRRYPYDFIVEAIDQTRGWFYTLHALGTMLFDTAAYKSVICAGHVVDEKGEKMSKSKGNVLSPREIIDEVGVDAVRLQFCLTDPGAQKRFSTNMVRESVLPFLNVLSNSKTFYLQAEENKLKLRVEDRWILSTLHTLIKEVTTDLENYALDHALQKIMNFVVNDFSRGYIKITRDRDDTKTILGEVLEKISLVLAPFAPYLSEDIYSSFSKESVQLAPWPKSDSKKIDKKIITQFRDALKIIEKGLAERDRVQIGLKWPLSFARTSFYVKLSKEYEEIIAQQLNVKKIVWVKAPESGLKVVLNTTMTKELEAEGFAREISRKVQAARKKVGFVKSDRIHLYIRVDKTFSKLLHDQESFIGERTHADSCEIGDALIKHTHVFDETIKGKKVKILFSII